MKIQMILALTLLTFTFAANADQGFDTPIVRTKIQQQFMVSAMLKRNTQEGVIRLVQSIEKASSKEEATGLFFKQIRIDFADYSVLDSLATPVKTKDNDCETWL